MRATDEASVLEESRPMEDSIGVERRDHLSASAPVNVDALVRFAMLIFRIHKRRIEKDKQFDRKQQRG